MTRLDPYHRTCFLYWAWPPPPPADALHYRAEQARDHSWLQRALYWQPSAEPLHRLAVRVLKAALGFPVGTR